MSHKRSSVSRADVLRGAAPIGGISVPLEHLLRRKKAIDSGAFRSGRGILLVVLIGAWTGWIALLSPRCLGESPRTDRGFMLKTYVDSRGQEHRYVVFVPYDDRPGRRRPLLMFLNGMGENGTDGISAISNNFGIQLWEMKRTFPFVAVAPQCRPEAGGWSDAEQEKALSILDRVAEEYGTDPDRVYVTGVSSGGSGVWRIVSGNPDRFAAAVPICGGGGGNLKSLAGEREPIWSFYNDGDKASLLEGERRMRQELLKAGASPLATEYPQEGHNSWDLAYRCIGMYDWLLDQSLSKNARQDHFELLSAEQVRSNWRDVGPET